MSLVWMGAISLMIVLEKFGVRKNFVSRTVGVLLVLLGAVILSQAFFMM
jgi:predicted metal-binding membrane protein